MVVDVEAGVAADCDTAALLHRPPSERALEPDAFGRGAMLQERQRVVNDGTRRARACASVSPSTVRESSARFKSRAFSRDWRSVPVNGRPGFNADVIVVPSFLCGGAGRIARGLVRRDTECGAAIHGVPRTRSLGCWCLAM